MTTEHSKPYNWAKDPCDGTLKCLAQKHIHGCYSDQGSCDEPREHQ